MMDFVKVVRVRNNRSAAMFLFIDATGVTRVHAIVLRIFGVATVNTFSSVNHMKSISLSVYLVSNSFERVILVW